MVREGCPEDFDSTDQTNYERNWWRRRILTIDEERFNLSRLDPTFLTSTIIHQESLCRLPLILDLARTAYEVVRINQDCLEGTWEGTQELPQGSLGCPRSGQGRKGEAVRGR